MVVMVAAFLFAGCGTPTLNTPKLERSIHTWAVKQENASPSAHVVCPSGVPMKAGSTFHCVMTAGGQSVRLTVTVENDAGYVTWAVG